MKIYQVGEAKIQVSARLAGSGSLRLLTKSLGEMQDSVPKSLGWVRQELWALSMEMVKVCKIRVMRKCTLDQPGESQDAQNLIQMYSQI
jgi:hypothetical protein